MSEAQRQFYFGMATGANAIMGIITLVAGLPFEAIVSFLISAALVILSRKRLIDKGML